MSAEKFTGYELSINAKYHYETVKEFAQDVNAQRIFKAYTRVIKTFQNIAFSCVDFKRKLKENKEIIVDVMQQAIPIIGNKITFKIFNISTQTFRHWLRTTKVKCHISFLHWCKKSYPHQLTNQEVENIIPIVIKK